MDAHKPIALIMAGGSGTRFWPLSQQKFPKQFITLFEPHSLLQATAERLVPLTSWNGIYVCGLKTHRDIIKQQIPRVTDIILEPFGRNTAPCLALSAVELVKRGVDPRTPMVVLPADHHIANPDRLRDLVARAAEFAVINDALVTFGIYPTSPHTGYGYIEANEVASEGKPPIYSVKRFIEKPNEEKAKELLRSKNCYWNAGIFVWTIATLIDAFKKYMPEVWDRLISCRTAADLTDAYGNIAAEPIDIAVMEKADNVYTLPADLQWSDIGSWNALYEHKLKDDHQNAFMSGNVQALETQRCLVQAPNNKKIALVGVEDLIIVEHEGTLLITKRSKDQLVKEVQSKF